MNRQPHRRLSPRMQAVAALLLVAVLVWLWWNQPGDREGPAPQPPAAATTEATKQARQDAPIEDSGGTVTRIENVTLRNQDGKVIYRGNVDLAETIDRIQAGRTLDEFRNDGSTFQNRERRLPRQRAGYYREFVHPTPGLSGPGPQRIVAGEKGELYYTPDHYESFQRLDRAPAAASASKKDAAP